MPESPLYKLLGFHHIPPPMFSIVINILLAIHVIVSLLIILVVLMQRPKSEGLGAAFGGGMTDNLFGAQTTNVLAGFTRWLGGIFFALTLLLSILYAKQSTAKSSIEKELLSQPKPAATATPAAATTGSSAAAQPAAPAQATPAAATPVIPAATATPASNPSNQQ